MRKITAALTGVVLLSALVGCASAEESEPASDEVSEQTESTSAEDQTDSTSAGVELPAAVGERYVDSEFAMTINSVRTEEDGDFTDPDEEVFLIMDVTLENLDDESTSISELLQFELQGNDDFKYDLSLLADTKGSLGGNLAAGSKVRGELAFDVPLLDSYTVLYQHDLFSDSIPFEIKATDLNAGSGSSEESSESNEPVSGGGIGETVTQNGVSMTLNSIRTSTESTLGSGPEEEIYLIIDATIENNTEDSLNLSELLSFDLRGSDAYAYDVDIFTDTKGSLGGEVMSGSKLRGEIAYDVPVLDYYEFFFEPSFFSGEPITFVINGEDL